MREELSMDKGRARAGWWRVLAAVALAGVLGGVAYATMHDGRQYAIEAAIEKLELKDNPFVLRESWWDGVLEPGQQRIIQQQLFRGNEYWFWAGLSQEGAKVALHIYDREGKLVEAESFRADNVAGSRVEPPYSGIYYIRMVVLSSDETPVDWAVIYAFR